MNRITQPWRFIGCSVLLGLVFGCAQPPVENQTNQTRITEKEIQSRFAELPSLLHDLCIRPTLAAYFAKSPCLPQMATAAQLKDPSKVTPKEAKAIKEALQELSDMNRDTRQLMLDSGIERYVHAVEHAKAVTDPLALANQQDLLNGFITWGEYNRRRIDLQGEATRSTQNTQSSKNQSALDLLGP